jgi:hypothetical protein
MSADAAAPAPRASSVRTWLLVGAACVVAVVPFAILVERSLRAQVVATSDFALLELRVRDVGSSHTPLVGVYSRYGWNHPGPLLLYLLAVPYRLFGSATRDLLIGGVLLNVSALGGAAWVLWRRGRAAGLVIGAVVAFSLTRSLGGSVLWFPWNPFAIVLPMFLLVLLAWSVACGDTWFLPAVVAVASFEVQSHVGSAVPAVTLLMIAVGVFLYDWARFHAPSGRAVLATTIGVALVAWLPPLVQQFEPGGGNLSALWRFWTSGHKATVGFAPGARIVASQFSLDAPWLTGHERIAPFTAGLNPTWHVPVALLLLLVAAVVAWRHRARDAVALTLIALAFVVASWVAAANVVDIPYSYILRWAWNVGAVSWLAIAWAFWRIYLHKLRRRHVASALGIVVCIALLAMIGVGATHAKVPDPTMEHLMQGLSPRLRSAVRTLPSPIVVVSGPGIGTGALADGVLLQLVRSGVHAGFPTTQRFVAGPHVVHPQNAKVELIVVTDSQIAVLAANPQYRLVTMFDRLSPSDRRFVENYDAKLRALSPSEALRYMLSRPADTKRLGALAGGTSEVAVFRTTP